MCKLGRKPEFIRHRLTRFSGAEDDACTHHHDEHGRARCERHERPSARHVDNLPSSKAAVDSASPANDAEALVALSGSESITEPRRFKEKPEF